MKKEEIFIFTALTKDNKKISIEKAIPDEDYICPACGKAVVVKAVKSNNVRTHFAHKRNCLCFDDWKHDMSDWHFEWQSKFPIDSREVVVEKEGVVHRADVLIKNTVIEFQHSPISGEEFEARNSFYKNCGYRVVWLFDAANKMKCDEDSELVWKRKTTLFSSFKTPIDGLFIQNYLPNKEDILSLTSVDQKEVLYRKTVLPIRPENFLKEFGGINDENVLSIVNIFEKTEEQNKINQIKAKKLAEEQRQAKVNEILNRKFRGANKRRRWL